MNGHPVILPLRSQHRKLYQTGTTWEDCINSQLAVTREITVANWPRTSHKALENILHFSSNSLILNREAV